ncbi:MAG TPA: hypothetical protein VMS31_02240 [Pyrinomonadaceae bacterium]|nr:hypothetical protein [Pyrinomonadaceae bacterium]
MSTVAPTLPAPPQPALVNPGTPEDQAVYFADLVEVPETRLAGWLGIYDALAIPVIGQDGKSLGTTDDDPIGPRYWQIWYASGLDKKGRGIRLSDAGRLLAAGTSEIDGGAMGPALLNDLKRAVGSNDPQVRLLGMFVRERIKRWPSGRDVRADGLTAEETIIDLPTLQMIAWVVSRNVLFKAASSAKDIGATRAPATLSLATFQASRGNPAAQLPCSEKMGDADSTYWTNWLMNKVVAGGVQLPGMENAFTGLVEQIQKSMQVSDNLIKKTSATTTNLNIASVLLSLLLQVAAMEINPSQDPEPLKRTNNTNRGGEGKIVLQLYSAPGNIPDGNKLGACMGSVLSNWFGVSFSLPAEGPIAGAEMTVSGGAGFPDLVLFNTEGTNSMRRWTGSDGVAQYKLYGAPQKRDLPSTAKEVKKEFSVHVKAQPEEAGLNSMLNIFFGGLTFGAAPSKAGGFGSAIDIAKGFQYDMGEYFFNMTDWQSKGYRATGRTADVVYSGVICSLDKPFTVIGTYAFGSVSFDFVPSSATSGTAGYSVSPGGVKLTGSGIYTIEGVDSETPKILWSLSMNMSAPGASRSHGGTAPIDLVPLETDECK